MWDFLALWIFVCVGVLVTQKICAMKIMIEHKIYYTNMPLFYKSTFHLFSHIIVCDIQ